MNKLVLFFLCGVFLQGCATEAGYKRLLNTWVGDTGDNLIKSWGPPTQKAQLSDNSQVFEYLFQGQGYVPQYTTPTQTQVTFVRDRAFATTTGGQTFGGYPVNLYCKTLFYIGTNDKITGWKYEGNSCRQ